MVCLITGCTLERGGSWVRGDLHAEGGCYVFNAALNHHKGSAFGEAYWQYDGDTPDEKVLTIDRPHYFERRGVIVIPQAYATLNEAAQRYIYD